MNGNIRRIFEDLEIPPCLHERAEKGIMTTRSVDMNKKINKKVLIPLVAVLCAALLCAAGWPFLREGIWGESAEVEFSEDGNTVAIEQSVFDPASYRPQGMKNMVYMPADNLGDPEAEIMTVFEELQKLETSPFVFTDKDGNEIENIGDYRLEIGGSINMAGPWSEFTLTREDENKFVMLDSEGCGFNYYIYPLTGDTHINLDYTPTGMIVTPEGDVKVIENGAENFTVEPGETVAIGENTATYKKGDRVRFTVKFKNVPEEALGSDVYLGYYLNPSDPAGETEGPAYRPGDGWFYPQHITLDEYETVMEYPLKLSGEYRFTLANLYSEYPLEVESFSAEVIG